MKIPLPILAAAFLLLPAGASQAEKPLVTLTVKRQVIDSDRDLHGRFGDSRQKTFTLRVEISNTSQSPISESSLAGEVIVNRMANERETLVRESLPPIQVPAMKPGERLTFDLGKIQVSEVEWRQRKFEETLEEWQVISTCKNTEIGNAVSSERFRTLVKEVPPKAEKQKPVKPLRKPQRRMPE